MLDSCWYLGHLMWRANSLEETLSWERQKAGKEGDDREQDGWMASLTQGTWVWVRSERWWKTGKLGVLQSMGPQSQTQLSDWTTRQLVKNMFMYTHTDTCVSFSTSFSYRKLPKSLNESKRSVRPVVWILCVCGCACMCVHVCACEGERDLKTQEWNRVE